MVDRDGVEREWSARGFPCNLWTDAPGKVWEGFTHATDELPMVVDGRVVRPEPGEQVLIPARARHSVRNLGRTTSHWLYGYFRG